MATLSPLGDSLDRGIRAGVERAASYELSAPSSVIDETVRYFRQILDEDRARSFLEQREISDQFVELFTELVTVAAIARYVNNDAPLSDGQVREYLSQTASFENSFSHA
jgi:hypothetical protein